jgi:hypothetical protein
VIFWASVKADGGNVDRGNDADLASPTPEYEKQTNAEMIGSIRGLIDCPSCLDLIERHNGDYSAAQHPQLC